VLVDEKNNVTTITNELIGSDHVWWNRFKQT
jgi:hypothetical protein